MPEDGFKDEEVSAVGHAQLVKRSFVSHGQVISENVQAVSHIPYSRRDSRATDEERNAVADRGTARNKRPSIKLKRALRVGDHEPV